MRLPKPKPRADYRLQEHRRVNASATLAEKYRDLKSLTVTFSYFSPDGADRNRQIKYTVNPEHARSVFRIDCINQDCVGGDHDLSDVLAAAVAAHETDVEGESCCEGWLGAASIDKLHCHQILRYEISIEYQGDE